MDGWRMACLRAEEDGVAPTLKGVHGTSVGPPQCMFARMCRYDDAMR